MKLIIPVDAKSTFGSEFKQLVPGTIHARFAVPFFTNERAVKLLVEAKAKVDLIVRICSATRHDVLKSLLSEPEVTIKFTLGDWFHTKLYLFDRRAAIFGSANLTKGGLDENHELSALLTEGQHIEALHQVFDALWRDTERVHHFDAEVADLVHELLTSARRSARASERAEADALRRLVEELMQRRRAAEAAQADARAAASRFAVAEARRGTISPRDQYSVAVYELALQHLFERPDRAVDLGPIWRSVPGAKSQAASITSMALQGRGIATKGKAGYIATEKFRRAVQSGDFREFED